jgi:hypothetical protein
MAIPKVKVYARAGDKYLPAEDAKGKLLQLPGTYYLRHNKHGKPIWQKVGAMVAVPAAKLNLERHLKRVTAALDNDLPASQNPEVRLSITAALDAYLEDRRVP